MDTEALVVEDPGELADQIAVSVDSMGSTYAALSRTAELIRADCAAVAGTLQAVLDALDVFASGGGVGAELGGFGAASLPLVGMVKMVRAAASQYVKQQTGASLSSWIEFVSSSTAAFDDYLSRLSTVQAMATRYRSGVAPIDPDQVAADEETLLEIRWAGQAWKQILQRAAQLGHVVDAMTKVNLGAAVDPAEEPGSTREAGFSGVLQRRIRDVQTRTTDKAGDLRGWILQPFVELRDRAGKLPAQTERLAAQASVLDVLLELQLAQLRVYGGALPAEHVRIVGLRVAAGVRIPELGHAIEEAEARRRRYSGYLERIDASQAAHAISDHAAAVLRSEYQAEVAAADRQLRVLTAELDRWRRQGPPILEDCLRWLDRELDLIGARRVIEQRISGDQEVLLRRERQRLDDVSQLLSAG